MIVKHANPCGVSVAGSIEHAYERALAGDPVAAYGGVVALNRPVSEELADLIVGQFVEVLFAPGYADGAFEALAQKPATRILVDRERRRDAAGERDFKRVLGGLLVQDRDWDIEDRAGMEIVCGSASEALWGDLLFAWRVCKQVTSNAIGPELALRAGVSAFIQPGGSKRDDEVIAAVEQAGGTMIFTHRRHFRH